MWETFIERRLCWQGQRRAVLEKWFRVVAGEGDPGWSPAARRLGTSGLLALIGEISGTPEND